jgi:hypothetical protein
VGRWRCRNEQCDRRIFADVTLPFMAKISAFVVAAAVYYENKFCRIIVLLLI